MQAKYRAKERTTTPNIKIFDKNFVWVHILKVTMHITEEYLKL